MDFMIDVATKGAVLLFVASLVGIAMHSASASARHLLWAVTTTLLLALPVVAWITPDLPVLPALRSAPPVETAAPLAAGGAEPVGMPVAAQAMQSASPGASAENAAHPLDAAPAAPRPRLTLAQVLVTVWLAGMLLLLGGIAFGFARVRALALGARPVDGNLALEVARIAREMAVTRVAAHTGDECAMPMTWGIVVPQLLLPEIAYNWPLAKLHAVLRHELAHIRRRDSLWQLIGETVCALHWFNPFAWHAARQLRIEREHACDDAVLMAGARASDYASELLELARTLRSPRATSLAAIAMAQPHQLEGRLLAVLDERRARRAPARKWPVWFAAVAIVVPVAAVRPATTADLSVDPIDLPSGAGAFEQPIVFAEPGRPKPASMRPPVPAGVVAIAQERCQSSRGRSNISINTHDDGDRRTMKWETGSCKGSLVLNGRIRIAGDLSGVESIAPGGDLTLYEKRNGQERELKVRPNGNQLVYAFELDGKSQPWNAEGRAWLSDVLTYLVRRVGFAADERVDYLLKQGGLSAVLREIDQMESDYVQRQYFAKLLDRTTMNSGALETVLTTATRTLQSDYEMAELLIDVARKYEFTEGVRRVYINAANTLDSDYEHRRALSAVLLKGGLSSDNVSSILASAKSLNSDYENAELLLSVANRYRLDPATRAAYLDAAASLSSDYEKGRVFKTLLAQGEPSATESANVLAALNSMKSDYEMRQVLMTIVMRPKLTTSSLDVVLAAGARIRSDYERAELLMAVLRKHELTPEQQQRVKRATEELRSDYERGRVAALLLKQMD